MEKVDFIIVGDGFAAMFFAHQLLKNKRSFRLYSSGKVGASHVSAGIVNPVVLKKFTTFDRAMEQIAELHRTLAEIEVYTGVQYFVNEPIHRVFHDEAERELWKRKAQDSNLAPFLSLEDIHLNDIENPFGVGKVNHSGRIEVTPFFCDLKSVLLHNGFLFEECFDYSKLDPMQCQYMDVTYKYVVFAEGMGVKNNPYFKDLQVNPNKGHCLNVQLPDLEPLQKIIKKKHFLFELSFGCDNYYYGGTYDRFSESNEVDTKAVEQLTQGLSEIYSKNIHATEVRYGFRPTVKDRRPILGANREFSNLYVFNGLGARGVLNGNYYASRLFEFIIGDAALPSEVALERFDF